MPRPASPHPCGSDNTPSGVACPTPADTAAPRPRKPAEPSAAEPIPRMPEPSPAASPDTSDVSPLLAKPRNGWPKQLTESSIAVGFIRPLVVNALLKLATVALFRKLPSSDPLAPSRSLRSPAAQ